MSGVRPARTGIVVTGTEVLTGRVTDANGPWVVEELRRHPERAPRTAHYLVTAS